MHGLHHRLPLVVALASSWALTPMASQAADEDVFSLPLEQLEQVIVLARKIEENVQEVPMSITAFRGEDLVRLGANDLVDLAAFVPNFEVDTANNQRNTTIAIRGIGTSGTNPGLEPSVGVFIDGVYMPSSAQALGDLSDIATVEVLRGPQGTLYGRNTPVGALNITTRRPDREFESLLRLGAGDYDHYSLNGFVGGALTQTSAARFAYWYRDRDGFERNLASGHRVNDSRDYGSRLKWALDPRDDLSLDVVLFASHREQRCCVAEQRDVLGPFGIASAGFLAAQTALGFPFRNFDERDHTVDAFDEGDDETDFWGTSVHGDWQFGDGFTLTSISAYQSWRNEVLISATALPQSVFISDQTQDNVVWSQELRVASPAERPFHYLAGLYLYRQDTSFDQRNEIGDGANRVFPSDICGGIAPCILTPGDTGATIFDQETRSIAAFTTLTFTLADAWDANAGARVSRDDKDVFIEHFNAPTSSAAFNFAQPAAFIGDVTRSESNVTWSVSSRYHFTPQAMGFVSIATGSKSGGFNARRQNVGAPFEFDAEDSLTYDVGLKTTWLEHRLMVNATLFTTELEDFQEVTFNPVTGSGFIVANAGKRRVRGIELDFRLLPRQGLQLMGSFAYADAEYTDYDTGQCPVGRPPNGAVPGTCDFTGETPPKSPRWKGHIGVGWTQPIDQFEFIARTDYTWTDDQNMSSSLDAGTRVDSYGLLNARIGVSTTDQHWRIEVYGKNITDESYFLESATQPLNAFVSGGGTNGAGGYVGWYGPPRTWGVELTWRR